MRKIGVILTVIFIGLFASLTAANYWLKSRIEQERAQPASSSNHSQPSMLYPTKIEGNMKQAPAAPKASAAGIRPDKPRSSPQRSSQDTQEKEIIYEFPLDDDILVQ